MIAEYILLTSLVFMFFGFIWSQSSFLNVCIKTGCWCFVAWGAYVLFGPMNIASEFIK